MKYHKEGSTSIGIQKYFQDFASVEIFVMIIKEGHLVLENIMWDILKISHKHMCH